MVSRVIINQNIRRRHWKTNGYEFIVRDGALFEGTDRLSRPAPPE